MPKDEKKEPGSGKDLLTPELVAALADAVFERLRDRLQEHLTRHLDARLANAEGLLDQRLKEYVKVLDLKLDAFRRPIPGVHV